MGGPTTPRPLRILVLADERKTLRHLSRFLGALGYEVQQVTTVQQASAVMESAPPDFLIIDSKPVARSARDLCRLAGQQVVAGRVYTLLMLDSPAAEDVTQAIEAGIDDFLAKPVVYPELLVRLRAGARVLEWERRLRQQSGVDMHTGLPNRFALEERLAVELAGIARGGKAPACVLADIDLLGQINHVHGWPVGDKVIRDVAGELAQFCDERQLAASLGGGRFAVLLPETQPEDAAAWAERVRALLADEADIEQGAVRATVSFGVAGAAGASDAAGDLLGRAEQALRAAKNSGRNCVAACGQFDEEAAAWAELAAPGRMFERTAVRDVMKPCPMVLRTRQTVEQAAALLHRTGLGEMPVVDGEGRLVGLLAAGAVLDQPPSEASYARVAEVMDTDVSSFEEDAPLAELIDFFTHHAKSVVVAVRGGRPTGLVTTSGLASLSEPLSAATFASPAPCSSASAYLLVADPCAADV